MKTHCLRFIFCKTRNKVWFTIIINQSIGINRSLLLHFQSLSQPLYLSMWLIENHLLGLGHARTHVLHFKLKFLEYRKLGLAYRW